MDLYSEITEEQAETIKRRLEEISRPIVNQVEVEMAQRKPA